MSFLRDYAENMYRRIREIPSRTDYFLLECLNCGIENYGDPTLREVYLDSFKQSKEYFLGFLCVLSAGFSPVPLPFPHGL